MAYRPRLIHMHGSVPNNSRVHCHQSFHADELPAPEWKRVHRPEPETILVFVIRHVQKPANRVIVVEKVRAVPTRVNWEPVKGEDEAGGGRADQGVIGKDASQANRPLVGMDRDQRVDTIIRPQFVAPASFGRGTAKAGTANLSNLHQLAPGR